MINASHSVYFQDNTVDIAVIEDLLKDINDGCALATLISFYCPNIIPVHGKNVDELFYVVYKHCQNLWRINSLF